MKYLPDLELPRYEFVPFKASTSRAIINRFSFGDSLGCDEIIQGLERGEGGVHTPTGSVSNIVEDQELQGNETNKSGIEESVVVGMSLCTEESHHHGGPIPSVHSEATIPENGVESRFVLDVRLTEDPGPGVKTPMGGRRVDDRSPSIVNGTEEWFRDVNSMVGRWEAMERDEGEWLPKNGRRRGGKRISRRMSELILGFEGGEADSEMDRRTDLQNMGSNVKISSFTSISNHSKKSETNQISSNVATRGVRQSNFVRKPCAWSRRLELPANRSTDTLKRKNEWETDNGVQTKRRRPGQ